MGMVTSNTFLQPSAFILDPGSATECKYQLLQHGIPVSVLPITEDGQLSRTGHLEWLNRRMAIELETYGDGRMK
jgi:hypothetical protein